MYLSREAIARTLDDLAALSCPGSDLLLTYIYRDAVPLGSQLAALGRNVFHFSGEYLRSWFAEGEFSALLEDRDFTVISDTNDREWARSLGVGRYFSGAFRVEHLIEARI